MKLHIFHNWTKWKLKEKFNIMAPDHYDTSHLSALTEMKVKVGEKIIQQRKCKVCNKIQIDTDSFYL